MIIVSLASFQRCFCRYTGTQNTIRKQPENSNPKKLQFRTTSRRYPGHVRQCYQTTPDKVTPCRCPAVRKRSGLSPRAALDNPARPRLSQPVRPGQVNQAPDPLPPSIPVPFRPGQVHSGPSRPCRIRPFCAVLHSPNLEKSPISASFFSCLRSRAILFSVFLPYSAIFCTNKTSPVLPVLRLSFKLWTQHIGLLRLVL